jgi:hypothetical protein
MVFDILPDVIQISRILEKRQGVFFIVVMDDGVGHATRSDGLSWFSAEENAQIFADELIAAGETLTARVEKIDGYGIPYDLDPEIYDDALRREAARRLRQADDAAQARQQHQWRREDTLLDVQKVLFLDAPAKHKQDVILALLPILGVPRVYLETAAKLDAEVFLERYAKAMGIKLR